MAAPPGYGPPNTRNPFADQASPYGAPLRQYPGENDYASRNASAVPLNNPAFFDSAPKCEHCLPSLVTCLRTYHFLAAAGSVESMDGYDRQYSDSVNSRFSTGTTDGPYNPFADMPGSGEPYPAWTAERDIPMSAEEIEDIFLDLAQKFGFQRDSMRNMVSCRASSFSQCR